MRDFSFFHSFPRVRLNDASTEVATGLQVLQLMIDVGLLLCPEKLFFPVSEESRHTTDGSYLFQKRACFTHIRHGEILNHASVFGAFALSFDVEQLRSLGAVPVIYMPQPMAFGIN